MGNLSLFFSEAHTTDTPGKTYPLTSTDFNSKPSEIKI